MIGVTELSVYLLGAANTFTPQSEHLYYEKAEVTQARYEAFAHDIAEVVLDPRVKPLFAGDNGRLQTGLLLIKIASNESHFKNDVMTCAKLGDKGLAFGPFQTYRDPDTTCQNNIQAAWVALDMLRESFQVCHGLPLKDRMSEYTDGNNWNSKRAFKRSEDRMQGAMYYMAHHPIPVSQDETENQELLPR
jgi:hypothetical protein